MARIRSVKPELRTSEVVASWPFEVRYFFVLLWGYLDDKGRGLDVPKAIAGDCFPHDDKVTAATIERWLTTMATTKVQVEPHKDPPICRYEAGGRRYIHCVNWREHQRPNRPTGSRLPPCPIHERLSEPRSDGLSEDSVSDSLPGAAEVDSRGAEEQQQRRSEPGGAGSQRPAHAAAVKIIQQQTDATDAEAAALAAWLDLERRPRNLAGLVRTIPADELTAMLDEKRHRVERTAVADAIAAARRGPDCPHGERGGASLHPTSGQPLCPLCRATATAHDPPAEEPT